MSHQSKLLQVVFACRSCDGKASWLTAIDVEEGISVHAGSSLRLPRIFFVRFGPAVRIVRIRGKVFPIQRYEPHFSNALCEAVWMEPVVVAALLNYVKWSMDFQWSEGTSELHDVWSADDREFDAAMMEAMPCA